MTFCQKPQVFGTGLIALDLVCGLDPVAPVRSWAGGTCGNVLSILAYLGWEAFPIARMNGDAASDRVRADFARWGVRLDFASCGPTAYTPIIIQEITRGRDGKPKHHFSWSCPKCGNWLPAYKAVTTAVIEVVAPAMANASVFFLDRLSRAALSLAERAADQGAIIVFEPSGRGADKLMADAFRLAHVVKYADQRLRSLDEVIGKNATTLLEVRTLGEKGLKYRHRLASTFSDWMHLDAIGAPKLADTCGAGDWLTAGFLAKAGVGGVDGLREVGAHGIQQALRYGQALASWNCGFEGARGGMYAVPWEMFEDQVAALLTGRLNASVETVSKPLYESLITCPACSRSRKPVPKRRQKAKRDTAA